MAASVKDVDKGAKALVARLARAAAKPVVLTVGIHEAEGSAAKSGGAGGLTLAEVGEIHEFGLGVPRRSFLADWADENRELHEEQLRKMTKAVVDGKIPSMEQAYERLGNLYVGEIQKRIVAGIDPPLAPATIARKGSSTPLVDTGQLKSAITFQVTSKDSK